jgi:hypothetical protein
MGNFFHGIFQFFFLIGYIILFVVTFIIIKPFRVHHRRQKSTVFLKTSYLLYLASFMIFTYLLLFGKRILSNEDQPYTSLFNIHFFFFLTSTLIPNLGIMLRRKMTQNRIQYNILMGIVNVLYCIYLAYLCASNKWALM